MMICSRTEESRLGEMEIISEILRIETIVMLKLKMN